MSGEPAFSPISSYWPRFSFDTRDTCLHNNKVKQPDVIIFDLDDTIITWNALPAEYWLRACREICSDREVDAVTLAETIRHAGHQYWSDPDRHRQGRLNLFETRRIVARLAFAELGIDRPDLANRIADRYSSLREDTAFIVPEAVATLERLRERGIRLAMITNGESSLQRAKLRRFELETHFDHIIVEEEFGTGKPEPHGFLHILETMNVSAGNAWMVGDDLQRDIAPARALGLFTVWVDGREAELPAESPVRPDRTMTTIAELPGILD